MPRTISFDVKSRIFQLVSLILEYVALLCPKIRFF